ncbi:DUF2946 family protein [uncultured Sphingomonas sp.]|uniref:DUF2946 family protein n=1 Tax=uncultured Sphingomonas sp. TaxID=158754 RepID=UPI0025E84C36|nr:DUF2946 family protein [uncultured Sphingomonas sp.]
MTALRRLLFEHRLLCGWVIAAALLMKALVPAGFMPVASGNTLVLGFCSGYGPQTMVVTIPGKADRSGSEEQAQKHAMPCVFSGLSMPGLSGVDPVLLVLAVAFVAALAIRTATAIPVVARVYLRPPLRGPPLPA